MFLIFNEEVRKVLLNAKVEMKKLKHQYVGTEHLVLSILKYNNFVSEKIKKFGITYDVFKDKLIEVVGVGKANNNYFVYTPVMKKIISNAILISKDKNRKEVSLDCLFLSLLEYGEGVSIRILSDFNVNLDELYEELNSFKIERKHKSKLLIEEFGVNLNKMVINSEIDPVVGRDEEVSRIIEILCRRVKNNPLLIGDAGVGKTAVVEELSRRIVEGNVPSNLFNKRVISVSMASLVSGTKYRGEFEERITKILKEVESNDDLIIFIDEIHTLVGAGGAEGAIDASNILKPALARGKIKVIGATTVNEYKKFMENDKALSRRFQIVNIKEPKNDVVYDILVKLKPIYESFHNVNVSNDVLKVIIDLSNKYIYDRKQPDKSIDLLDEVCSKVSIVPNSILSKNLYYKNLLKTVCELKNNAIKNGKFNEAIYLKEEESKLESYINKLDVKMNFDNLNKKSVTVKDVVLVIESKSNIPVYEYDYCFNFDDIKNNLSESVLGQDSIISSLVKKTFGLFHYSRYSNKPLSFLFVGQTGVGKTFLAKEYGKLLFGEDNIIKLDMSEYKEEHSISKIIGSPPGYVGYQSKECVLEEIKNKPYSLLILDEIDKAHSSVINLFLNVLDEGKMKNSNGDLVRFDNVVIIMTSNACSKKDLLGFNNNYKIEASLNEFFSSEFINRIGNVFKFNSLSYDDIKKIVIKKISDYLLVNNSKFDIKDDFVEAIIEKSNFDIYGARKIDKIIVDKFEDYLFKNSDKKMIFN